MISISPSALLQLQKEQPDLFLLDVREPYEREIFHIGGILIPLGDLLQQLDELPETGTMVVYCRKGVRSQIAIQRLQEKKPGLQLINLTGGMDAWQREIIP
jgi:adenylyltransferase/sulfurtransferase